MGRDTESLDGGSIRVSNKTLSLTIKIITIAGLLASVILACTKFYLTASAATPQTVFDKHVLADSIFHVLEKTHTDFQDSAIVRQGRDVHALVCYLAKNDPTCKGG